MDVKNTFEKGVMNKDLDERLIPKGYYTHAENIITNSIDGSDVGVVKNILSNKINTMLDVGVDVDTIGCFSDETEKKVYYFLKSYTHDRSQTQTFLIEYDDQRKSATVLLHDTRREKVLNISVAHRISFIRKIYNDDSKSNLLLWTDNNMEVCCLNINRARSFLTNGFTKEDIYLIKKPPIYAPGIEFVYSDIESNEIEDKFISFAYRYKYRDGEYSALSPLSYYNFVPKEFLLNYDSLENKGMENNYNAISISFNTGGADVISVQVIAKFSNSDTLYVVETFDKEIESLANNTIHNLVYNNKKLYTVLPEKELYRTFDNVPRKAKALTLIGNRVVLGNYTEGYNMVDADGSKIKMNYGVDVLSKEVGRSALYNTEIYVTEGLRYVLKITPPSNLQIPHNPHIGGFIDAEQFDLSDDLDVSIIGITTPGIYLSNRIYSGYVIVIELKILDIDLETVFEKTYSFISNENLYVNELPNNESFIQFIESVNYDIKNEINYDDALADGSIDVYPYIEIQPSGSGLEFIMNHLVLDNGTHHLYIISEESSFIVKPSGVPSSLKSHRDYEVGIVYQDEYKRASTVQTTVNNTVFIPISKSTSKNKLSISINHKPPYWAKYYRIAVKSRPLQYEVVYANRFYVEDGFTWVLLEGSNKDKVKEDDVLLVKKTANGNLISPVKVKVLEVTEKERDFIKGNKDTTGFDIEEKTGLYMKIKAVDFSMGNNDYKSYQSTNSAKISGSGNYPTTYVDLFSTYEDDVVTLQSVSEGSIINIFIDSGNKPDSGDKISILNKEYRVDSNYNSIGEWFEENIISLSTLYANEGNDPNDYAGNIEVVRGFAIVDGANYIELNPNGKEYLKVTGTKAGMSGGRFGRVNVVISLRTSDGYYVFETIPKKEVDLDIYHLSSETFLVENGVHKGNVTDQNEEEPAVCNIDFFNCYTFGNGVESYKILDGFNENYLNIDYSPTTTTIEGYREVNRRSDITWSSVYNESTNINGLNEFNTATLNWKELDKQHGEIRLLHAREGDLLVIQEDKWSRVLYGKTALYSATGEMTVSTTDDLLRDVVYYTGEYGITDPDSFVTVAQRAYAVDKKRGTVLRLSNDGINEITRGMEHWFKTSLQSRRNSNIIGGYDPYYGTYNITIEEDIRSRFSLANNQLISIPSLSQSLNYNFDLSNSISNSFDINYVIGNGVVDLDVGGTMYQGLSGSGTINHIAPESISIIDVSVLPINNSTPNIQISNTNIEASNLIIETIVINSINDAGGVFSKGIKVSNRPTYRDDIALSASGVSQFITEQGEQGSSKFPTDGDMVSIFLYDDDVSTKQIDFEMESGVRYLLTSSEITENSIEELYNEANNISFEEHPNGKVGYFAFNREQAENKLVIIYNLRPLLNDVADSISVDTIESTIPFSNVFNESQSVSSVIITTQPINGIIEVENFNSFKITYTGISPTSDIMMFNYDVKINGKSVKKKMTVNVSINE